MHVFRRSSGLHRRRRLYWARTAAAATGAFAASGAIAIGGSAALTGIGALAAGGSVAIGGAAALTAAQNFTASGQIAIGGAVTLTAIGTLAAAGVIALGGSAALVDGGAVAGPVPGAGTRRRRVVASGAEPKHVARARKWLRKALDHAERHAEGRELPPEVAELLEEAGDALASSASRHALEGLTGRVKAAMGAIFTARRSKAAAASGLVVIEGRQPAATPPASAAELIELPAVTMVLPGTPATNDDDFSLILLLAA